MRCRLLFIQKAEAGTPVEIEAILNLFVCARYPSTFFAFMEKRGVNFKTAEGQPWLYEAQVGWQTVKVVVCRDLPLESVYYPWLLFAPSDSMKWRKFIVQLAQEKNIQFLELARELRPKEYQAMSVKTTKYFSEYTPEEREQYWAEYGDNIIEAIPDLEQEAPEALTKIVGAIKPETLVAALKPETLAALSPEQRQRLLQFLTQPSTSKPV